MAFGTSENRWPERVVDFTEREREIGILFFSDYWNDFCCVIFDIV